MTRTKHEQIKGAVSSLIEVAVAPSIVLLSSAGAVIATREVLETCFDTPSTEELSTMTEQETASAQSNMEFTDNAASIMGIATFGLALAVYGYCSTRNRIRKFADSVGDSFARTILTPPRENAPNATLQ